MDDDIETWASKDELGYIEWDAATPPPDAEEWKGVAVDAKKRPADPSM